VDANTLAAVREALEVYDVHRREALLTQHPESELTRFLVRLGAFGEPYEFHDGPEIDYTDWNGALVGRGPSTRVRNGIRPDPTLPGEELAPLAGWEPRVRLLVARHPATPASVLQVLASDDLSEILYAVGYNQHADDEVYATLSRREQAVARGVAAAARRCPRAVLERLSRDPNRAVQMVALGNPNLPPALERLDDDVALRRLFAGHPLAPAEVVDALVDDRDRDVRIALASNRAVRASVLADLATDPVWEVRAAIAQNAAATEEIWHALAQDSESKVRLAVANSPFAPADVLVRLAKDALRSVRAAVLLNANSPEGALIEARRH
jgi:hypothetical protein